MQDVQIEDELGHPARRHGPGGDLVAAVPKHQPHGGVEGERGGAHGAHAQEDALVGLPQGLVGGLVELGHLEGARREGADHPDALEVFLHGQRQHAHQSLHAHPCDPQKVTHLHQGEDADRHEGEREQRQDFLRSSQCE